MVTKVEVFENKYVGQIVEGCEELQKFQQELIAARSSSIRIEQKLRGKCLLEHFQDLALHELLEKIRQKECSCQENVELFNWFILGSCPKVFSERLSLILRERMDQIEVFEIEGRCKKFVQERTDIPPTQLLLALKNVLEEAVAKDRVIKKTA